MPGNWIADIRSQISMPDLVGIWVELTHTGNCWKGLCPFHPDKATPSLAVYKDHAHCYGCDRHWDAVSWVKDKTGLSFGDAVMWLQDRAGIIPQATTLPHSRLYTPTTPIPLIVLEYWHSLVVDEVREYFHNRCLTDNTIDFYMLGYDGRNFVIPVWEGKPQESLVYGVKFRRSDDVVPKYFGLRGRSQPKLFNKFVLKDAKEAVIVLGEFDAILGYQLGLAAVSPTSGQNAWLVEWTRLFDNVETVFVLPDQGEKSAGYSICSLFGSRGHLCEFPKDMGKDLTEFIQRGYVIKDLRNFVLFKETREIDLRVRPYWEENGELPTCAARI